MDQDNDDDLVLGTKDGKVAVYINNGDINTTVLAAQLDIGDDASPDNISRWINCRGQ